MFYHKMAKTSVHYSILQAATRAPNMERVVLGLVSYVKGRDRFTSQNLLV